MESVNDLILQITESRQLDEQEVRFSLENTTYTSETISGYAIPRSANIEYKISVSASSP
jgi:hypothetical protein